MTRSLILLAAILALTACEQAAPPAAPPSTTEPVIAPAPAQADLADHLAARTEFTTFAGALQAAGLTPTLRGAGPWTVFAPDNAAFDKIPVADREALMLPERRIELRRLLAFHLVPGRLTLGEVARRAQAAGGKLTLTTLEGGSITLEDAGAGRWAVTDGRGGRGVITEGDEVAANGLVHRLDSSLAPG